jgi:DNA-binding transcriptional LysR family regulator
MNRLEALRIFGVAAEASNFREAAAKLAVSPQVITRVVRELESLLGEPLFHRSTRGVRLTTFGEQLSQRAGNAVAGVDELFAQSRSPARADTTGVVRVAAPSGIGRNLILRELSHRLTAHPGLVIDLRLSEVIADVVGQQIDVGVRIGTMRDSRFVARPASRASLFVVGSPALVARVGRPRDLDALFQRPTTALIDRNTGRAWPWMFKGGQQVTPNAPSFVTDDPEAECAAVLAGLGFGQLPGYLALAHVRKGKLVPLLEKAAPDPATLYVYRPHRSPVPARVRVVFDALLEILAKTEEA